MACGNPLEDCIYDPVLGKDGRPASLSNGDLGSSRCVPVKFSPPHRAGILCAENPASGAGFTTYDLAASRIK